MNPWLRDLYDHQAWADAEHWRAIEAHPSSVGDAAIKNRLHHIHLVQKKIGQFLETVAAARLEDRIDIPWFTDPPLSTTVAEALTQCAMHSQWHRGQNATRLRELGAEPPAVDFIVWLWKGRPAAVWE